MVKRRSVQSSFPRSTPSFLSEAWYRRFKQYFAMKPMARQEWDRLLFNGCNPLILLRCLPALTDKGFGIEETKVRAGYRAFAKQLQHAIRKLRTAINALEVLNGEMEAQGADPSDGPALLIGLSTHTKYIGRIEEVARGAASMRSTKPIDCLLAFLHFYIQQSTGGAQWHALSTLLEAGHYANGCAPDVDPDMVRKRVERFIEKEPAMSKYVADEALIRIANGNGGWPTRDELLEEVDGILVKTIVDALNQRANELEKVPRPE